MKNKKITLKYIASNISVIVGIVLIWRGVWYVLDAFDSWAYGGSHFWTSIGGVVLGLLILYLPDKDLKEIEKL